MMDVPFFGLQELDHPNTAYTRPKTCGTACKASRGCFEGMGEGGVVAEEDKMTSLLIANSCVYALLTRESTRAMYCTLALRALVVFL